MPNQNYIQGRRKENMIKDKLKSEGWDIVQRSASSKSPVDIWAINKKEKKILLIQSKRVLSVAMNYTDPKHKEKIEKEFDWLSGEFKVEFEVM